jgi:hypothetical protein
VVPFLVFFITRRVCRDLQQGDVIEHDREQAEAEAQRVEA